MVVPRMSDDDEEREARKPDLVEKKRRNGPPRVSDKKILHAFESLCEAFGVVSRGFQPGKITAPIDGPLYEGKPQWAINHSKDGWMVVGGKGGCGVQFVRWDGYIRTRWDFLMLLEALTHTAYTRGEQR